MSSLTISEKIKGFKQDLVLLSKEEVFYKYFIQGNAYLFEVLMGNLSLEQQMKEVVSSALATPTDTIFLVGSSKIGFSVSPMKLFQPIDGKFNKSGKIADKSDLDVAIVNSDLFGRIGREAYNHTNSYRKTWEYNEFIKKPRKRTPNEIPLYYKFFEYFAKGWFKMEYRPPGYDVCAEQWNYQKLISEIRGISNRHINIAIYSDEFYFKSYHLENIANLAVMETLRPS